MNRLTARIFRLFGVRRWHVTPDAWRFPVLERVVVLDDPDKLGLPTLSGPIVISQGVRSLRVPYIRPDGGFGCIEYADLGYRLGGDRAFRMTPESRARYEGDMAEPKPWAFHAMLGEL